MTPFDITPTHFPPSPHPHIPDPIDFDPEVSRNINKPQPSKSILIPSSVKGRHRHTQFDASIPHPKHCTHTQPESSLPPSKPFTIPVLESDSFSEKYVLGDVGSANFSLIHPRLPPSNSASKHTSFSLDPLSEDLYALDITFDRTVTLHLLLQSCKLYFFCITTPRSMSFI